MARRKKKRSPSTSDDHIPWLQRHAYNGEVGHRVNLVSRRPGIGVRTDRFVERIARLGDIYHCVGGVIVLILLTPSARKAFLESEAVEVPNEATASEDQ